MCSRQHFQMFVVSLSKTIQLYCGMIIHDLQVLYQAVFSQKRKKILTKFKLLAALVMINIGALKDY